MTEPPDPTGDRDAALRAEGLPSSLVPRWLALLVLMALLAAASLSVCSLLAAEPPRHAIPDRPAASGAPGDLGAP